MSERKRIPWVDILVFLGLPLVFTLVAIGAILTPQVWTVAAISILTGIVVSGWTLGIIIVVQRFRALRRAAKYMFTLDIGYEVYSDIADITKAQVESAVEHFIKCTSAHFHDIERDKIVSIFSDGVVTFRKDPIKMNMKKYAGLADGKSAWVYWNAGFKSNAYFHELAHILQEYVLIRPRDYRHEDKEVWDLVAQIKKDFNA